MNQKVNPDHAQRIIQMVNEAQFPNLLSMKMLEIDQGRCKLELVVDGKHLQPLGLVHGGVIASLIDTATYWSGYFSIPETSGLLNVDLRLNYLRAVPAGAGRLIVEGREVKPGRSLSYTDAQVFSSDGKLIAHGNSTLFVTAENNLQAQLKLPSKYL